MNSEHLKSEWLTLRQRFSRLGESSRIHFELHVSFLPVRELLLTHSVSASGLLRLLFFSLLTAGIAADGVI